MGINEIGLITAALLPAVVLCVYVFKKDRVEKEPIGLLLLLLALGVLSCFPAAEAEKVVGGVISGFFARFAKVDNHIIYLPSGIFYIYNFFKYFIGVALIEEGIKWIILKITTMRHKEFNCLFDGMIYAIFVSLGFAAFENVLYVTQYGWMNALTRGVLSVPGHMFFAVMMGWHYSIWNIVKQAHDEEARLKSQGVIDEYKESFNYKKSARLSIIIPVLAHGFYDFCCTIDSVVATVIFSVFIVFMYKHCFGKISEMSEADEMAGKYVRYMLLRKYPELRDEEEQTINV